MEITRKVQIYATKLSDHKALCSLLQLNARSAVVERRGAHSPMETRTNKGLHVIDCMIPLVEIMKILSLKNMILKSIIAFKERKVQPVYLGLPNASVGIKYILNPSVQNVWQLIYLIFFIKKKDLMSPINMSHWYRLKYYMPVNASFWGFWCNLHIWVLTTDSAFAIFKTVRLTIWLYMLVIF